MWHARSYDGCINRERLVGVGVKIVIISFIVAGTAGSTGHMQLRDGPSRADAEIVENAHVTKGQGSLFLFAVGHVHSRAFGAVRHGRQTGWSLFFVKELIRAILYFEHQK